VHRAILEACLPCVLTLAASFAALTFVVRLSGARLQWRRISRLHSCQDGGVHSLAFVLTLPVFLLLVLFIVQISQLMVGMMVVNYSAFAAARAASVWIPAQVEGELFFEDANQNRVRIDSHVEEGDTILIQPESNSDKYQRIRAAAVLACASVAPSRDLEIDPQNASRLSRLAAEATKTVYRSMVPRSTRNPRIDRRLDNKIAYSDQNTMLFLEWRDARNSNGRNTFVSPTYNPREHPVPDVVWHPNEAGWQDALRVYVVHRFALLPGPGRWFAQRLVWVDSLPSRIQSQIASAGANQYSENASLHTVLIPASATITNEGFKSVRPYTHEPN